MRIHHAGEMPSRGESLGGRLSSVSGKGFPETTGKYLFGDDRRLLWASTRIHELGNSSKISPDFRLGGLVTEASHPVTANLDGVAHRDISEALGLLFEVDRDVVDRFRDWAGSGAARRIAGSVLEAIRRGRRVFFVGCGSTGRLSIMLDSIWRGFWHEFRENHIADATVSVMAGGDFALIKSVEGFEDFAAFGARQISERGVSRGDVVFAITEGGETSFVIGAAWQALESGAKVYFVYNNPDDILSSSVERSRRVIEDPRIEKINLTTGPMAITGSTRMQATTIQLCVMLTVLEMAARESAGLPIRSTCRAKCLPGWNRCATDLPPSRSESRLRRW